jgi:hypothetical protein
MDITLIFFNVICITGLILLYFTIKNLLPGYFNEKGKNLATKQDVTEITQLVETVKHSFVNETEKLKANLSIISSFQIGLFTEERNSIIDYNEKYFQWLHLLTDTSLGNVDDNDNILLETHSNIIKQAYTNLLLSETRFNLFVGEQEIHKKAKDLQLLTLKKLGFLALNCIVKIQSVNYEIEALNVIDSLRKKQLIAERQNFYQEFQVSMLREHKEVLPISFEFQSLCRKYLYKLIEENKTQ